MLGTDKIVAESGTVIPEVRPVFGLTLILNTLWDIPMLVQ
jgi:hypothetical protein